MSAQKSPSGGGTQHGGKSRTIDELGIDLPPFDPEATGRVVRRVEILSVELVSTFFDQKDAGPLPSFDKTTEATPGTGIEVEWAMAEDQRSLGCLLTFGTLFEGESDSPYQIVARFRAVYAIEEDGNLLEKGDVDQFAHWNAMFNVWPYWREFVANITDRGDLPRVVVPVMRVPNPG